MTNNLNKGASNDLFRNARNNRKNQTEAELTLWKALRNRKVEGFKFRRQHPLRSFIVDFYCHEYSLAIEVDGGYHNTQDQSDYDNGRTFELNELGIKVIRFKNEDVMKSLTDVIDKIKTQLLYQKRK